MTQIEESFWCKVYAAAIRRGYTGEGAGKIADVAVEALRARAKE